MYPEGTKKNSAMINDWKLWNQYLNSRVPRSSSKIFPYHVKWMECDDKERVSFVCVLYLEYKVMWRDGYPTDYTYGNSYANQPSDLVTKTKKLCQPPDPIFAVYVSMFCYTSIPYVFHPHKKNLIKENYLNMWLHNSCILFTFVILLAVSCLFSSFCAKFSSQMFLNFTFTSLRHVVQIAVVVLKIIKKLMWFGYLGQIHFLIAMQKFIVSYIFAHRERERRTLRPYLCGTRSIEFHTAPTFIVALCAYKYYNIQF